MGVFRRIAATLAAALLIIGVVLYGMPESAAAHCDTLDGPVAVEAQAALESGNPAPLFKWVQQQYEDEIGAAFAQAQAVRSLGSDAQELADRYFIETLIRLHREGEGAPYTGLKPAGQVAKPVAEADRALDAGSVDKLAANIGDAAELAVRNRFERLLDAAQSKDESTEAGRRYVEAYVVYVHFVEELHHMIAGEEGKHDEH
jgi:hypothetical protein